MTLDLNTIWFVLIGVLLTVYAILDGFDFGVGAILLFFKKDEERRILLNSIGPVWDGNEVWLIVGGGALFAAFPNVYATVFSGFYLAFILLLFALIFRAVSIESRNKQPMTWWKNLWDTCFCTSSITASLLFGVALGNLIYGVPLDANGELNLNFLKLLHPYSILTGISTVALFLMHGSLYALVKTEGELQVKIKKRFNSIFLFFVIFLIFILIATWLFVPHIVPAIQRIPSILLVVLFSLLMIFGIYFSTRRNWHLRAFLCSCLLIASLMVFVGISLFPNLVMSNPNPEYSLTIYNAASSPKTLLAMLRIVMIGMPFILLYTILVYWIFRGKVRLDKASY
jgi:cytochrome d ubiquinol oxidase subunit II